MPRLKNELPLNSFSSRQNFELIFRDAQFIRMSMTKNQSLTENVNEFLQEQSKNFT